MTQSGGYRADPDTLSRVAGILRTASQDLDGAAPPPTAPALGSATAAVADLLGRLSEQAATAVQGVAASADAVVDSRKEYEAVEHWSADSLPKPGPTPS